MDGCAQLVDRKGCHGLFTASKMKRSCQLEHG